MIEVSIGKADLLPGEHKCLDIKGKYLSLANIKGKFYCIDSVCMHEGGQLCEGKIGEMNTFSVTCPLHGSIYDYKTGKVLKGPSIDDVKSYKVTVKNGELFVNM